MKTSNPETRFVVADDDLLMCDAICEALRSEWPEAEVVPAMNGFEVAETVDSAAGEVDALILDLFMPDMDGLETLRAMRRDYPHVPAILITGGPKMALRTEPILEIAQYFGARAILHKPFSIEKLTNAVRTAVGRGVQ